MDNMKKTGLKESVQVFSGDYNTIDTSDILDIHRFLTLIRLDFLKVDFSGERESIIRTPPPPSSNFKKN